jgi:hypothetical protein
MKKQLQEKLRRWLDVQPEIRTEVKLIGPTPDQQIEIEAKSLRAGWIAGMERAMHIMGDLRIGTIKTIPLDKTGKGVMIHGVRRANEVLMDAIKRTDKEIKDKCNKS